MATLDPSLDVLRDEILSEAPQIDRSEIGWIAGADHRQSGPHFPEYPAPPGNPPYEVDAIDVPHAPSRGMDCAVLTEQLRTGPNRHLLRLVIFDGQQFSNYARDGIPPFTWRPYSGEDMHREHAHIERNDSFHGDKSPWGINLNGEGEDMGKIVIAHDRVDNTLWACDGLTRRVITDKQATDLRHLSGVGALAVYDGKGASANEVYTTADAVTKLRPALLGAWKAVNDAFGTPALTTDDIRKVVEDALDAVGTDSGPLSPEEVAAISSQVVAGLGALRFEPTTAAPSL